MRQVAPSARAIESPAAMPPFRSDPDWLLRQVFDEGASSVEIAVELGTHVQRAQRALGSFGIRRLRRRLELDDRTEQSLGYLRFGSLAGVARHIGVHPEAVGAAPDRHRLRPR